MTEPAERAAHFDLAHLGELIADPSRVAMLLALMDGTRRPASELARAAGVTASTASSHLGRLVKGGLLVVQPIGRHRYYALGGAHVAEILESLMAATAPRRPRRQPSELALARTCYRHLAGEAGVRWLAVLEARRFLEVEDGSVALTERGRLWLAGHGMREVTWPHGKLCLDWTERRNHLGGPLGTKLTDHLFARGWLAKRKTSRAVRVTTTGQVELARLSEGPSRTRRS